jgi:hypothetical protein
MVPEGSLQHSQAPTTCPYRKSQQSSPCIPIPHHTSWRYILILSSHLCLGVPSSLSLRSPHPKPCMQLSCLQYVPHAPPISFFLFDHPNNVLWGLEIIKLLVMQSSWLHCYLVPLRPKCLPQYRTLEHPQPMFFHQCDRPSLIPIQNNRQNCSSEYLNHYLFEYQTWRRKILHQMISIAWLRSHLNYFMSGTCSQMSELFHPLKGFITYLYGVMIKPVFCCISL